MLDLEAGFPQRTHTLFARLPSNAWLPGKTKVGKKWLRTNLGS
jgi:hypothetical protein